VDIVNKHKYASLQVAPIANPAMPSPVPMPNIIGMLPGMTALGTMMMKSMMGKINWPSVPDLMEVCLEMGVKMVACTPTLEMTGVTQADLLDGVEVGGAADYLDFGLDADINLFV
jgi:peroxiredoxin family protein